METPILRLAENINRITGNPSGIVFRHPRRWDGISWRCADIARAVTELNYCPKVFLAKGLAETYRWFARLAIPRRSVVDELRSSPDRDG